MTDVILFANSSLPACDVAAATLLRQQGLDKPGRVS